MRRPLACGFLLALALAGASAVAASDAPPQMGWTAIDRFGGDADGDGRIDAPGPLRPAALDAFAVRLRPSAPICADLDAAAWRVDGRPVKARLEPGDPCAAVVHVAGEGSHMVAVLAGDRQQRAAVEIDDTLIVALGDSVASGEGNPRGRGRWLDPPCHRSSAAGFEQAARRLAAVEGHRSIAFVSLACSGAEVGKGLLGPYAGVAPQAGRPPYEAQVARLGRLAAERPVGAVLLSVGANDVGFAAIVAECGGSPGECGVGNERRVRRRLAALAGRYDRLGAALDEAAPGVPVLISEYFDPTHDERGRPCSHSVGFTSRAEARWAYESLLRPLNARVAEAAARNEWMPIGGIAADFRRHGYCAGTKRWVRRLGESLLGQGDVLGTLHPNEGGHSAIALRVALPLAELLDFTAPQPPPAADEGRSIWAWIGIGAGVVVSPSLATAVAVLAEDPSSAWRWLVVSWLLAPLLAGLLILAARALTLLRPTWPPDPGDPGCSGYERPSLATDGGLTLGRLLLIALGIAILFAFMVIVAGLAGRAILWLRFWSARLPADQAISEVSSAELVSTGAAALAILFALGLLAAGLAWLLDGKGRWVRATRRGLVAIGLVEVLVAIMIGDFRFDQGLELFVGVAIAALLLNFLVERALTLHRALDGRTPVTKALWARLKAWDGMPTAGSDGGLGRLLWKLAPLPLLAVAVYFALSADGEDRNLLVLAPLLAAAVLFAAPGGMAAPAVGFGPVEGERLEALRMPRVALALTALACIAILLVRDELWLAGVVAAAVILGLFCYAVAAASKDRFGPYGLAVLVSVPLFGGAAAFLHGVDSPELQPVAAVLRGGEAVCGVYVGESDGRLWLGRLVLDERAGVHRPKRGAISPLAADAIEARALGPLEPVDRVEARARALRDGLLDQRGDRDPTRRTPRCQAPPLRPRVVEDRQRDLADRYQPELVIDRRDGFWPVPVSTLFSIRDRRATICRRVAGGAEGCLRLGSPGEFPWIGGAGESLEYPAADDDVGEQHDQMVSALGSADPEGTATEYYLVHRERRGGAISIQYWFFYPFNYQPVGGGIAGAGYHEGDFESIGVLLSARSEEPRYVWMARHNAEGRVFPWSDEALRRPGGHPRIYAARGSHATYENCLGQVRPSGVEGLIDDHPTCRARRQLRLAPEVTPLTDLSRVGWGCWQGLFGHRNRGAGAYERIKYVIADAPRSPLWQQSFGGVEARPCRGVSDPGGRDGVGEETVEEGTGVPARLRRRAGDLENVLDECADWEAPTTSGTYMVVCNQRALAAYVRSGLEDPGTAAVRIEAAGGRRERGPVSLPALRRNEAGTYLDEWRLSAARLTRVSVFASCPSRGRVIAVRFKHVTLRPGRPLRLRDRDPSGRWLLIAPDGSPVASAIPFPTRAQKGLLVPAAPRPGRKLACGG